jgi:arylsulfatase A-like enzyme
MKITYILIALFCACMVYCLLPLSSREFLIQTNRDMLPLKEDFLENQRDKSIACLERPPNVIVILADDLGKTDISLYGSPHVNTRHIDALGRSGVVFSEAYSTSPISAPSRAALITGRYQQRFGFELQPHDRYPRNRIERTAYRLLLRNENWEVSDARRFPAQKDIERQGLPLSEITLSELLRARGYATAIVGKWHLGIEEAFVPNNRGFDFQYGFYEAFSLYAPVDQDGIVNHRHDHFANRYIWKKGREGPSAIRRNNVVIEEHAYLTTKIAGEAASFIESNRGNPFFLYVPFSAPHTPFQVPERYYKQFSHVADRNKRVYYAMIQALDDAVGEIVETVHEFGLDEQTLIFFASDNGGATYTGATDNAPLKGGKFSNFEGGLNIPFVLTWKGIVEPGTKYHHPVSLMDIFVTSVTAAGAALPEDRVYDGVNLLPYINGSIQGPAHETLVWRSVYNHAIRHGRWKLILNELDERMELYDLVSDKSEALNELGNRSEIIENLLRELNQIEREFVSPLWPRVMDYHVIIDGVDYAFAI